jgi:hypothetical protein
MVLTRGYQAVLVVEVLQCPRKVQYNVLVVWHKQVQLTMIVNVIQVTMLLLMMMVPFDVKHVCYIVIIHNRAHVYLPARAIGPTGAVCGVGSTAEALTVVTGTWKLVTSTGDVATYTCPGERCDGSNCTANRKDIQENPLCGSCISDEYSEWGGQCVHCTQNNSGYIFLLVLISFGYVLFLLRAAMGNSSSHTKIFSYFLATARYLRTSSLPVG